MAPPSLQQPDSQKSGNEPISLLDQHPDWEHWLYWVQWSCPDWVHCFWLLAIWVSSDRTGVTVEGKMRILLKSDINTPVVAAQRFTCSDVQLSVHFLFLSEHTRLNITHSSAHTHTSKLTCVHAVCRLKSHLTLLHCCCCLSITSSLSSSDSASSGVHKYLIQQLP